jgi:hypothetical protein
VKISEIVCILMLWCPLVTAIKALNLEAVKGWEKIPVENGMKYQ